MAAKARGTAVRRSATTHKIQMVIEADTRQIICVHFENGSCHDFRLYKNSGLRIHPGIRQKVDSGYPGADKLHGNTQLPRKNTKHRKLTKEYKRGNRQQAKERVGIEHINGKAKVFKILENRYRSHARYGLRLTLIASFINANAA